MQDLDPRAVLPHRFVHQQVLEISPQTFSVLPVEFGTVLADEVLVQRTTPDASARQQALAASYSLLGEPVLLIDVPRQAASPTLAHFVSS
jgi:hypothetical protein